MNWGDIYKIDLGGSIGNEINGIIYCVIVQNNYGNIHSTNTIIAMIDKYENKDTNIPFLKLPYDLLQGNFIIRSDMLTTVSKSRFIKRIAKIPNSYNNELKKLILQSLNIQ